MHDVDDQDHKCNKAMMHCWFLGGSRAWSLTDASLTPSIVRHVEGPSSLSGCKGKPKPEHSWRQVCRLLKQTGEAGTQSEKIIHVVMKEVYSTSCLRAGDPWGGLPHSDMQIPHWTWPAKYPGHCHNVLNESVKLYMWHWVGLQSMT